MKIYFCGSISGGRSDADVYASHIKKLGQYGEVLTEHVGSTNSNEAELGHLTPKQIHDRDLVWLDECDAVVAEVTVASLGVGYEVGRAVGLGKPVLCLFRPQDTDKKLSCMIRGSDGVTVVDYKLEEIDKILKDFFAKLC